MRHVEHLDLFDYRRTVEAVEQLAAHPTLLGFHAVAAIERERLAAKAAGFNAGETYDSPAYREQRTTLWVREVAAWDALHERQALRQQQREEAAS